MFQFFIQAANQALDEVERSSGPAGLVTMGGEEKFYSNGLDLGWLLGKERTSGKISFPMSSDFSGD